jgi:hypothetical protein
LGIQTKESVPLCCFERLYNFELKRCNAAIRNLLNVMVYGMVWFVNIPTFAAGGLKCCHGQQFLYRKEAVIVLR